MVNSAFAFVSARMSRGLPWNKITTTFGLTLRISSKRRCCNAGTVMSARDRHSPERSIRSPTQSNTVSQFFAASTASANPLSSSSSGAPPHPFAYRKDTPSSSRACRTVTAYCLSALHDHAPMMSLLSAIGPISASPSRFSSGSAPPFFRRTQDSALALRASSRNSGHLQYRFSACTSAAAYGFSNSPRRFFRERMR